jgi:S1-C subfamily serine protease
MKTVGKLFGMGPPPKPEPRGFLGFAAASKGDQVVVTQIVATGPADVAGLKIEDVIQSINDKKVESESAMKKALGDVRIGEKVTLTVRRGDQQQTLSIVCGRGF